jgi:hypothetical protein
MSASLSLSVGAIAGIAVGSVLLVAGLSAGLWFIWGRTNKTPFRNAAAAVPAATTGQAHLSPSQDLISTTNPLPM